MRTLILALTVLLFAAPVWATVTITAEQDDTEPNKVWISYASDEAELIRAFALDITVTDGNIIAVEDYAIGDDNGGYGIFPGSFAAVDVQVDPGTGDVVTWAVDGYSPVAPSGDPDALGGIGTGGVTVEMGSLYDTAAPSQTEGILCSVIVEEGAGELCVTANAIRGNVVLESAAEVQALVLPSVLGDTCLELVWDGPPECTIVPGHPSYDQWVLVGKPECWCANINPRQCHGDAVGDSQGRFNYWVSTNDLAVFVAGWNKIPADIAGVLVNGTPVICADIDHKPQGRFDYRVSANDLGEFVNWWNVANQPDPDCP